VRRKDLSLTTNYELKAGDMTFPLKGARKFNEVLNFAVLQKKSFDFAGEAISSIEAVDIANKMLTTHKYKDQEVSIYYDSEGYVGITDKTQQLSPVQFLQKVEDLCDGYGLSIGNHIYHNGYMIYCNLDSVIKLVGDEVYKPCIVFTHTPSVSEMSLGLWRLACANGSMAKVKGTTHNLLKQSAFKSAERALKEMITNPEALYTPVKERLEFCTKIPASLYDLILFKRVFSPALGLERSEQIFREELSRDLFDNIPENPPAMWLRTAPLPLSVYDLYNIGTNLTTHEPATKTLNNVVFLQKYLFQSKPLESICHIKPRETDIFEDIALLKGESV